MDWVVMAMGGWGGTVEEVGLFVAQGVHLVVVQVVGKWCLRVSLA